MFNKEGRFILRLCLVLAFLLPGITVLMEPAHAVSSETLFPIATTAMGEGALSAAFDGTNYLVGIQGDATAHYDISAQLVSQSGTLLGSRISLSRTGGLPFVAFDGTNYLMIWQDDATDPKDQLYGVFLSKAGSIINAPFVISGTTISEIGGIAFGGGKYLTVYYKTNLAEGKDSVYGRLVSPSGTVENEISISTGYGTQGFKNVAFDGANFFVVWDNQANNTEVKGRFVSPTGALGTEITVKAAGLPNDNPLTVAFDGTNYLVVWTEQINENNWDMFGQLVTPAGAISGGVISISTASGQQFFPLISVDGTNYIVTWTDMRNDTNWDIYGQLVSKSGALVGSEFVLNNDSGNKIGGVVGPMVDGKMLCLIDTGITVGIDGEFLFGDVYGEFLNPSRNRSPAGNILLLLENNSR